MIMITLKKKKKKMKEVFLLKTNSNKKLLFPNRKLFIRDFFPEKKDNFTKKFNIFLSQIRPI
jgi:hypothetical protein